MGATKRVAEIYIRSLSKKINDETLNQNSTRLIITRFGNVLGSNGSVIPHFENQIQKGGPVTVTHPDITRYFMTIPEACRLVLEAGNFGTGGEIFVFDMGDLVKIKDLAEKMIRLSGLEPYKDVDIIFTGLRPGEKLYEELLYDKETMRPTNNPKITKSKVREYDYQYVYALISNLTTTACTYDGMETVRIMKQLVPEYISQNSIYSQLDTPSH
jgi:FlaA1/EpsC-like NDP-sugar epimerase